MAVPHLETKTDEEIVILVQTGDTEAFGALVDRYESKLTRYGRKFVSSAEDVKDLVQDIFLKAYQNIQSFDVEMRFSPWIYRIAHNVFVDKIKKASRNPLVFVDFDTFLAHPVYDDIEHSAHERVQMRQMIDQALEKISPKYREVLVLYYLEELSYKEIADVLSVPISTAAIRLKRGREALGKVMQEVEHGTH